LIQRRQRRRKTIAKRVRIKLAVSFHVHSKTWILSENINQFSSRELVADLLAIGLMNCPKRVTKQLSLFRQQTGVHLVFVDGGCLFTFLAAKI
jgi:hypothetical protein